MLERILEKKAMILTLLFAVVFGGIASYMSIGKLEDAEIPIKTAMVITVYPGASAHEVELEVTDVLEDAINRLENIKSIESISKPGVSMIEVNIRSNIKTAEFPQLWDHLRRKVGDAKSSLPATAFEPIVNDDFADTYGILYAVTGDEGYTLEELQDYTEYIEKNITSIKGVRRSQIFGKETKTIEVAFSTEKLANMNINPMMIALAVQEEGRIVNPGMIRVNKDAIRVGVGNKIGTIEEVKDLLVSTPQGNNFRLGDIADVKFSYLKPKQEAFYFNGRKGFALGFSNESGVNVVKLGEQMTQRLEEVKQDLPLGIEVGVIYDQAGRVKVAVSDFMWNLVMSVVIVIVVLLFAMGLRSGLLIGSGLVFTILGTIIVMFAIDMPLHRVTLSSIILAMGMLVDNSIVVADGILVNLKNKVKGKQAFVSPATKTAIPLLGATLIAILAFMPLGFAPSTVGEFNSSMFWVLVISLGLSWFFAMIQTPFMAESMLGKQKSKKGIEDKESATTRFFRRTLELGLNKKNLTLGISLVILVISLWAARFMKIDFMPGITYDQFVVEYYLPKGSDVEAVEEDLLESEKQIREMEGVRKVVTSIGRPPARYNLMRLVSTGGNNYGEFIIEMESNEKVVEIIPELQEFFAKNYPDAYVRVLKYGEAFSEYSVEAQFEGPDPAVLLQLGKQAEEILNQEPKAASVTTNWGKQAKTIEPTYSVERGLRLGLSRNDLANSILIASTGMPIGAIYEGTKQVPIVLRTQENLDNDLNSINTIPVWGQRSAKSTPLNQIADIPVLSYENQEIHRYNGVRMIRVQGEVKNGYTDDDLQKAVEQKIEAINLPKGYSLQWEGTKANSQEANDSLMQYFPLAIVLMLLITIALFNNFRQPIIIFSLLPFAFVGIVAGFLLTGYYFNFMSIIGTLGLMGMMIKNSIVLLDEINLKIKEGFTAYDATIESTVSRVRPVMMASLTTILGMLPLLGDEMFKGMAVAIMFGLLFGSIITLVVVPVLYAVLFRVKKEEKPSSVNKELNEAELV